jgi:hypothetical protein
MENLAHISHDFIGSFSIIAGNLIFSCEDDKNTNIVFFITFTLCPRYCIQSHDFSGQLGCTSIYICIRILIWIGINMEIQSRIDIKTMPIHAQHCHCVFSTRKTVSKKYRYLISSCDAQRRSDPHPYLLIAAEVIVYSSSSC